LFENKNNGCRAVLRSETYLNTGYQPDEPVGRTCEISRIVDALQPLTKRRNPENLLVYGPAGVGKTTCIKHVFNRLEEETRVKTVYINAWQYNTRPSLLTELLVQLGYPAPRKGKPVDELLSKTREWLDKNRAIAVAIDEFDQLKEDAEVVYDLQLLNNEAENHLGTTLVSNKPPEAVHLDQRSQSRLSMQTLQFQPYTAPQLQEILEKRVEQAFRPGTVPDKIIQKIAEHVAENNGDCRQALEQLLRAGRKADRQGDHEITEELIQNIL